MHVSALRDFELQCMYIFVWPAILPSNEPALKAGVDYHIVRTLLRSFDWTRSDLCCAAFSVIRAKVQFRQLPLK